MEEVNFLFRIHDREDLWLTICIIVDFNHFAAVSASDVKSFFPDGPVVQGVREEARLWDLSVVYHPGAQLLIFRSYKEPDLVSFVRASGDVPCGICGRQYWEHPEFPGTLIVACDGTTYKL